MGGLNHQEIQRSLSVPNESDPRELLRLLISSIECSKRLYDLFKDPAYLNIQTQLNQLSTLLQTQECDPLTAERIQRLQLKVELRVPQYSKQTFVTDETKIKGNKKNKDDNIDTICENDRTLVHFDTAKKYPDAIRSLLKLIELKREAFHWRVSQLIQNKLGLDDLNQPFQQAREYIQLLAFAEHYAQQHNLAGNYQFLLNKSLAETLTVFVAYFTLKPQVEYYLSVGQTERLCTYIQDCLEFAGGCKQQGFLKACWEMTSSISGVLNDTRATIPKQTFETLTSLLNSVLTGNLVTAEATFSLSIASLQADRAVLSSLRAKFDLALNLSTPFEVNEIFITFSQQMTDLFKQFWHRVTAIIGDRDDYCAAISGSGGRFELCPFSDLEYCVITQNPIRSKATDNNWLYFSSIVLLAELFVVRVGESDIKGFPISSSLIDGFSYDTAGCAPGYGMQMIGSAEQLAKLHASLQEDGMPVSMIAINNLLTCRPLLGKLALHQELNAALNEILDQQHPLALCQVRQYLSAQLIEKNRSDLEAFKSGAEYIGVKGSLLRLISFLINSISIAAKIPGYGTYQKIEGCVREKIIDPQVGMVLKEFLQFSLWLRARTQLLLGHEADGLWLTSKPIDPEAQDKFIAISQLFPQWNSFHIINSILQVLYRSLYDPKHIEAVKSKIEEEAPTVPEVVNNESDRAILLKQQATKVNEAVAEAAKDKVGYFITSGNQDIRRVLYQPEGIRQRLWKDPLYNRLLQSDLYIGFGSLLFAIRNYAHSHKLWGSAHHYNEAAMRLIQNDKDNYRADIQNYKQYVDEIERESNQELEVIDKLNGHIQQLCLARKALRFPRVYPSIWSNIEAWDQLRPQHLSLASLKTYLLKDSELSAATALRIRIYCLIALQGKSDYLMALDCQRLLVLFPAEAMRELVRNEIKNAEQYYNNNARLASITRAFGYHPTNNGERRALKQDQINWFATLPTIFLQSQQSSVQLEWYDRTGQKCQGFLKAEYGHWFDKNGKLNSDKLKKLTDGRRVVIPLQVASGHIPGYLKFFPEMPGVQFAVDELCERVSGQRLCSTMIRFSVQTNNNSVITYPAYFSQARSEGTLQDVLRKEKSLKRIEAALDPYAFTMAFFESLLFSPEDEKADNLVVLSVDNAAESPLMLLRIDSDHAFVDALTKKDTKSVMDTRVKVQLKTLLFCFKQMYEELDPTAVETFLSYDPMVLLTQWLEKLEQIQTSLYSNSSRSLFKLEEIRNWLRSAKDQTVIPCGFLAKTVATMYYRFCRIQSALSSFSLNVKNSQEEAERPVKIPMDLLRRVEPILAAFYEEAFESANTPEERFANLPTEYELIEDEGSYVYQSIHKRSQSTLRSLSILKGTGDIFELKNAIIEERALTPTQVLAQELIPLYERLRGFGAVINKIYQGEFTGFDKQAPSEFKESIVNKVDWARLGQEMSLILIKSLFGGDYSKLDFSNCRYLTNDLLLAVIEKSRRLRRLRLQNCVSINGIIIEEVAKNCQFLEYLNTSGTSISQIRLRPEVPYFRQLRQLNVSESGSRNFLVALEFTAPKLEFVRAENCNLLSIFLIDTECVGEAMLPSAKLRYSSVKQDLCLASLTSQEINLQNFEVTIANHRTDPKRFQCQSSNLDYRGLTKLNWYFERYNMIVQLDLLNNRIDDKALIALCKCITYLRFLEILNLRTNAIADKAIPDLVVTIMVHLKYLSELNLSDNKITDKSTEPLTDLIKGCRTLRRLNLIQNDEMTSKTVIPFQQALDSSGVITEFGLFEEKVKTNKFLGKGGTIEIKTAWTRLNSHVFMNKLRSNELQDVNISEIDIDEQGVADVFDSIKKTDFRVNLNVSSNRLYDSHLPVLAGLVGLNKLSSLNMQVNHKLSETGKLQFFSMITKLNRVIYFDLLDLSYLNSATDNPDLRKLMLTLINHDQIRITSLYLDKNNFIDSDRQLLIQGLQKRSELKVISLYWNNFSDKALAEVILSLAPLKKITTLNISRNKTGTESLEALSKLCDQVPALCEIDITKEHADPQNEQVIQRIKQQCQRNRSNTSTQQFVPTQSLYASRPASGSGAQFGSHRGSRGTPPPATLIPMVDSAIATQPQLTQSTATNSSTSTNSIRERPVLPPKSPGQKM